MKKSLLNKIIREEVKAALGEASNPEQIKKEVISRLSDFFRVAPNALSNFKFDGTDNMQELTRALNSTSDKGTELYYQTAIKTVKRDLGVSELRVNEAVNPELDKFVSNFVNGLARKYSYKPHAAVMAIFEAMKRLSLIHKDVNYKAPSGMGVVAEGAYESATRNELAMYISLLSTALRNEKADGNTAMVDFLTKDIEEVKAALKAKGGGVAESSKPLKEYTKTNFQAIVPGSGRAKIDPAFFAKLMPKSAKTSKEAEARIKLYNGSTMFVHSQYFEVTPNGNMPNKPKYQLYQQQYYNNDYNAPANLKGESVNVTFLTVFDITNGEVELGVCYVDTKVFLAEYKVIFQLLKSQS